MRNLNDVHFSEPYRMDGIPYPVRTLSWCFCGRCGPSDATVSERWARRSEASAYLLTVHAIWTRTQITGHAEMVSDLHRHLLDDIRRMAKRQGWALQAAK